MLQFLQKLNLPRSKNFWANKHKHRQAQYQRLPGYRHFLTIYPATRNPQAGVTILLAETLTDICDTVHVMVPEHLRGFLVHIRLESRHSATLHIIGVYYPTSANKDTTPSWTAKIRDQMNAYIREESSKYRKLIDSNKCNIIIAGDFNGVAYQHDRTAAAPLTQSDRLHMRFVQELASAHSIYPTQPSPRPPTYYNKHPDTKQRVAISRIDDILTTIPQPQHDNPTTCGHTTTTISTLDMHTDHDGLQWKCPFAKLNMLPPPPTVDTYTDDGSKKVNTPISAEDAATLKSELRTQLEGQLASFNAKVQLHLISSKDPDSATIDNLGEELTTLSPKQRRLPLRCVPRPPPDPHPIPN
eukprot:GHRQ01020113.1.p1 GENE.GHRQ01020113.1~~GHRQ01020113.1.p1  ORF type:complete len:356 (+),score=-15.50 GHRQ01020113.1:752-1819(+)